ncbi:hypothetical protein OAE48_00540 [Flavobacteriales bacterium]|nr:hypothetical protein [Flavobacteriales bacterium]
MFRLVFILFISALITSCESTKTVSDSQSENVAVPEQMYEIMLRFKNEEGLKRTLYQLSRLSLEVKEEVSATDHLYMLRLKAKPYSVDGTVEKIGLLAEVDWAKRVTQ